jgi:hypothetical protein
MIIMARVGAVKDTDRPIEVPDRYQRYTQTVDIT